MFSDYPKFTVSWWLDYSFFMHERANEYFPDNDGEIVNSLAWLFHNEAIQR